MIRSAFVLLVCFVLTACAKDPSEEVPAASIETEQAEESAEAAESQAAEGEAAEPADEAAAEPAAAAEIAITPENSSIEFIGSKVTAQHPGGFRDFSGSVTLNTEDVLQSSLSVTIQMASTYSDNERLTGHLLSEDFFDAANIPTATFRTQRIEVLEGEGGSHTITGALNLHGVEQTISFPANVTLTDAAFTATAEFSINRSDFGITYPGRPDDLIREGVVIKLNVNVPRA